MFLKLSDDLLLNINHIVKMESGTSNQDGKFIIFYHASSNDVRFTKMFFGGNEEAFKTAQEKILKVLPQITVD